MIPSSMIFLYMFICSALVVFEFFWLVYVAAKNTINHRNENKIYKIMYDYCKAASKNKSMHLSKKDKTELKKALCSSHKVLPFAAAYNKMSTKYPKSTSVLMNELADLALPATNKMCKIKNSITKTYVIKLLCECAAIDNENCDRQIIANLFSMLKDKSMFCRVNALVAISTFGKAEDVVHAVGLLANGKYYVHPKMLTEAMGAFRGNHTVLSLMLCRDFDKFSEKYRIAILEYFTDCSPEIGEFVVDYLKGGYSIDVVCSTLRYFKKYPFDGAFDLIAEFVTNEDDYPWEIVTVATRALSSYDNERVKGILKGALKSRNWYTRRNAAGGLVKIGMNIKETADILHGDDRYASEILKYNIDTANAKALSNDNSENGEVNAFGNS